MPRSSASSALAVVMFLGAAVAANLVVAAFGQIALVFTAWILIPCDLLTRDILHERWRGRGLWMRMAGLILAGSALTAIVAWDAQRVALASFVAFLASGAINAAVYHQLQSRTRFFRMNASNLFAAIVDSIAFPLVAFGGLSAGLSATQAASKFIGGILWSAAYLRLARRTS